MCFSTSCMGFASFLLLDGIGFLFLVQIGDDPLG